MKRCMFLTAGFAAFSLALSCAAIDASLFAKKCTLTLSGYQGASDLVDFPVLVRLSSAITGFSYADLKADGTDLCFTDSAGEPLPYEIDTWNPDGESLVWVRVHELSGTATQIKMYYGSASATENTPSAVWIRYAAVVHGGSTPKDSASGLDVFVGSNTAVIPNGKLGVGYEIPDRNNDNAGIHLTNPLAKLTDSTIFTISGWMTFAKKQTHIMFGAMSSWGTAGFLILNENGNELSFTSGTSGHNKVSWTYSLDEWVNVAVVYDNTTGTSYYNGNLHYSHSIPAIADPGYTWGFGNYGNMSNHGDHLQGKLDEWRIFNGAATADWLKAEYDSVANAAFIVAGEVKSTSDIVPTTLTFDGVTQNENSVTVLGTLSEIGDDVTSVNVTLIWGTTEAMQGTLPVNVGTYTEANALTANLSSLTSGQKYYVAFKAINSLGETTFSPTGTFWYATSVLWRPQNATDTWASEAWMIGNGLYVGTQVSFLSDYTAKFDGAENNFVSTVNVPEAVAASGLEFSGNKDYTITGAKIDTPTVTKSGSGTVTIDGDGFAAPESITVSGGVMRLGPDAQHFALGSSSSPVYVRNASFDLAYTNQYDHHLQTHSKIFHILGEGQNGKGTIYNENQYSTNPQLYGIVMEGDATVGSPDGDRFHMQSVNGSANAGRPFITGPADATLTITGQENIDSLMMVYADINVGTVKVINNTIAGFERDSLAGENWKSLILDHGQFRFYALTYPFTVPVSAINAENVLSCTSGYAPVASTVTVTSPGSLKLSGGDSGSGLILRGGLAGDGEAKVTLGWHYLASNIAYDTLNVAGTDANAPNGGVLYGDHETSSGTEFKMPVVVTEASGMLGLAPAADTTYRNIQLSGPGAFVPCSLAAGGTAVARIEDTVMEVGSLRMGTGSPNAPGYAVLGNGTSITVTNVYLGDIQASPASATLTLDEGSQLIARNEVILGRWSGNTDNVHKMVIDGGYLAVVDNVIRDGYDTHYAELWLNKGTLDAKGIDIRYQFNYYKTNSIGRELFVMNGGTLRLGPNGLTSRRGYPICPQVWMAGGTVKGWNTDDPGIATPSNWADTALGTDNWGIRKYLHTAFETWGTFNGPFAEKDTAFTFDVGNGDTLWNTAIQGAGNVVIKGTGSFTADTATQGGLNGSITVENTGANQLGNLAGIGGGLTLAENVTATINIGDEEHFAGLNIFAAMLNDESASPNHVDFGSRTDIPSVWFANDIQALITTTPTPTYTDYRIEGEFEVVQAGVYTFACTYDDKLTFWVDDTLVCENAVWNEIGTGSVTLTAGWHAFRISAMDLSGGAGPNPTEWKNKQMALGYRYGGTSSTAAADYEPFSTAAFKMRPATSVRLTRHALGSGYKDAWVDPEYDTTEVLPSLQVIHSTSWEPGKLAACELSGWFYVEPEIAGEWTFDGVYDDRISLKIDGETIFSSEVHNVAVEGTAELTAGWHAFQIRTYDYGGGISSGRGNALAYTVPGGVATPFDERTLRITATPYGRIGGEIVLNEGSLLHNLATTPCGITGTLSGTGTLNGFYAFKGGTYEMTANAMDTQLSGVTFLNSNPDTLAEVGKIKVTFNGKPGRNSYLAGPALGLEKLDAEQLAELLDISYVVGDSTESCDFFAPKVENGKLYLTNTKPSGTFIMFR